MNSCCQQCRRRRRHRIQDPADFTGHRLSDLGVRRDDTARVVVIELKQWSGPDIQAVEGKDGIVKTPLGGGPRETTHPSYQAISYGHLLRDFNTETQEKPIELSSVAYFHNFEPQYQDRLDNEQNDPYTEQAPLYLREDAKKLRSLLESQFQVDNDRPTSTR